MDKIRQWLYYVIIGVISFIALVFLPMVGSEVGMNWNLPTTTAGWIVWIITKIIVSVINVLLFHCFMCQAKINVKDNEKYQKALEMLYVIAPEVYEPLSPRDWTRREYRTKAITIFATTAFSSIALTQAVLSFDYIAMLTYLFTIIMGIVFGVIQMKKAEEYWTQEFYDYAVKFTTKYEEEQQKKESEESENVEDRQQDLQELGRTSPEE